MPSPAAIAPSTNPPAAQGVRPKTPARPGAEEAPDAASGGFAALFGMLGNAAEPLQEQVAAPLPGASEAPGDAAQPAAWIWIANTAVGQGQAALPGQFSGAPLLGGQAPSSQGLVLSAGRHAATLVAETARMDSSAVEAAEMAADTGRAGTGRPGMARAAPAVAAALAAAAQAQAKGVRSTSALAPALPNTAAAHSSALAPSAQQALADSTAALPARPEGAAGLAAALRSAMEAGAAPSLEVGAPALAVLAPGAARTGAEGRAPGQGAGGAAAAADLSQPATQPADGAPAAPGSDASAPALPESASTLDAVTEQMAYWAADQLQNAELTLAHDGRPVQVRVSLEGQHAHVAFRSDQSETRALLDAGTGQLRDLLGQEGLVLSGVSVGSGNAQSDAPPRSLPGRGAARQAAGVVAQAPGATGERPQRAGVLTERKVDLFV